MSHLREHCPDYRAHSVLDITANFLKANGYKLVLLDLDETLTAHGSRQLATDIDVHVRRLRRTVATCIISNTYEPSRAAQFADWLNARYVIPGLRKQRWKPSPWCLQYAMRQGKCEPWETLMVGDLTTDVQAAKRAGCPSVLVDPISGRYPWYTRLRKLPRQHKLLEQLAATGQLPGYLPSQIEPP